MFVCTMDSLPPWSTGTKNCSGFGLVKNLKLVVTPINGLDLETKIRTRWTSIPCRGSRNNPSHFMPQKMGEVPALGWCADFTCQDLIRINASKTRDSLLAYIFMIFLLQGCFLELNF